jgi:hypothetical protein
MEITERDLPFATRAAHAHDRVERNERDAHVARVRGDALFALAENGVNPMVTIECPAATTGACVCYTLETLDRKNNSNVSAASDSRPRLPCYAVAGLRPKAAPGAKQGNAF